MKKIVNLITLLVVAFVAAGVTGAFAQQDTNQDYQKQLEEWEKKKAAIEKANAEKLAKSAAASRENEKKRAYNEGNTLLKSGRNADALAAYDRALKADSTFAVAHYGRGLALKKLRRYNEAIKAYKNAIRFDPTDHRAYFALGNIYTALDKHKEAIAVYDQAIANDPKSEKAYYQKGAAYLSLGQVKEAINAFRMATQINPNYYQAYYSMGVALVKLGQLSEAVTAFESSLALRESAPAYFKLAETYNKLNRYNDALEAAENGLKKRANYAPAAFEAGMALKSMGRYNEATAKFRIAAKNAKWRQSANYQIEDIKRLREEGTN